MSQAIDDLLHEHEAILAALEILEAMVARMESGVAAEPQHLAGFVGFLQEFADKCHHGKEEGLLFPALVAAGVPERGDPIGVMLAEHVQGRGHIQEMLASLGAATDEPRFAGAARAYAALLRAHIEKENGVLFVMAERLLSAATLDLLYEGFERHEEQVIGHGRHEELHGLLEDLHRRYVG
jgi:hemerythrin-like domain-containing protein